MTLEGIDTPQKLNLEVRIEGCDAVNDWDFWVYPAQVELVQGTVYTTDTLDAKALAVLQDGGNVLITAAGKIQVNGLTKRKSHTCNKDHKGKKKRGTSQKEAVPERDLTFFFQGFCSFWISVLFHKVPHIIIFNIIDH